MESRCFALHALITQVRILKYFWVENSTNLLNLPIPSSDETWKNLYKHAVPICFRLSWHFKREKPFWVSIFIAKQELITRTLNFVDKTSRLKRIALLISNLNKEFFFFLGTVFYKSNRKLFSCVCIAWYKHSRGWENSWQLCKPETKYKAMTIDFLDYNSCTWSPICTGGVVIVCVKSFNLLGVYISEVLT